MAVSFSPQIARIVPQPALIVDTIVSVLHVPSLLHTQSKLAG